MNELTCLELSVILWVAHVLTQAFNARGEFGDDYLFSPRDGKVTPKGLAVGRATRALHNYIENYVPFLAVDLGLIATQHTGGMGSTGATIWIIARILYLPVYMVGTKYLRTACWAVGVVGMLMMLGRLAGY
ncbi:MAG: MAPEG family protein [Aestuariivirga sp.]